MQIRTHGSFWPVRNSSQHHSDFDAPNMGAIKELQIW